MVKHSEAALDAVFAALSDPTRRQVLASLSGGSQPVSELANAHAMSLPGFMKHLDVLEDAGLIDRLKEGRSVFCSLSARPMQEAVAWLLHYQKFWNERLDALGRYLYHQKEVAPWPKQKNARRSRSPGSTTRRQRKSGAPGRTRQR